jgi:Fe-S cluster assembly protein SufD
MVNTVLTPVQKRGQANLERLGLPTRRQEAWRLTDLKRLEAMASLPSVEGSAQHAWPSIHQGVTRFVIGTGVDPLEGVQLPEGVSPLSEAELEQALGHTLDRCGCAETWPVELNHARSQRVLALRVRGSVAPLEIVLAAGVGLVATRVLLLLEEKAELDLFQVIPAERESAAAPLAHSHVIEVHLGQEARLRHGVLASASGDSSLLAHLAVEQEPRSSYDFVSVCRGWRFGRLEPRVLQVDGQATTRLTGLAMTGTDEQFATHTSVRFEGPEGSLDQLQKAFQRRHPGAQGCTAHRCVPAQSQSAVVQSGPRGCQAGAGDCGRRCALRSRSHGQPTAAGSAFLPAQPRRGCR